MSIICENDVARKINEVMVEQDVVLSHMKQLFEKNKIVRVTNEKYVWDVDTNSNTEYDVLITLKKGDEAIMNHPIKLYTHKSDANDLWYACNKALTKTALEQVHDALVTQSEETEIAKIIIKAYSNGIEEYFLKDQPVDD